MKLCGFEVGHDRPFFLIAGPCVVESEGLVLDIAGRMQEITAALGIPYIFKASYDKANRSSKASFRGPGIEEGLRIEADAFGLVASTSDMKEGLTAFLEKRPARFEGK